MKPEISLVMKSNLFTMGITSKNDPRQQVGEPYSIPIASIRELRARIEFEECLEKLQALGVQLLISTKDDPGMAHEVDGMDQVSFVEAGEPDLWGVVDASCDQIYVAIGTLVSCGVPDLPHLAEVCTCNDAKFPGGKATTVNGKFQKPDGWKPPNHEFVSLAMRGRIDLQRMSRELVSLHSK